MELGVRPSCRSLGYLGILELLCATFAINSSLLEEDSGLGRATLGGVCSGEETALAWELRKAVQLLLVEYCLGLGQSGLGGH